MTNCDHVLISVSSNTFTQCILTTLFLIYLHVYEDENLTTGIYLSLNNNNDYQ